MLDVFSALVAGMALAVGLQCFADHDFRFGLMMVGLFLINLSLVII